MPDIPANFFKRSELQALILKSDGLRLHTSCPEQGAALSQLITSATILEGILAELPKTSHPVNKAALDNPNGWESSWVLGTLTSGDFGIGFGQQVLKIPGDPKRLMATGRYMLAFGDQVYKSADKGQLRALLVRYVEELPETAKAFFLDKVFA